MEWLADPTLLGEVGDLGGSQSTVHIRIQEGTVCKTKQPISEMDQGPFPLHEVGKYKILGELHLMVMAGLRTTGQVWATTEGLPQRRAEAGPPRSLLVKLPRKVVGLNRLGY